MSIEEEIEDAYLEGKNIYLSGQGGSGKTYFLKKIYNKYKSDFVFLTSTTGVSAYNIGGRTLHSWAGFICPSNTNDAGYVLRRAINRVKRDSTLSKRWKTTETLFIDEVSMLGGTYLTLLDMVAKHIRKNDLPFGGIQILCTGDFLQLESVKDVFAFEADIWNDLKFKYFNLTTHYRFDDDNYIELLKRARIGKLNEKDCILLKSRIKSISEIKSAIRPTILLSKNADVDDINKNELDRLKEECVIIKSKDEVHNLKGLLVDQLFPKEIEDEINAEPYISLKKGAQVMLTVNLDIDIGLVNGSIGVVSNIGSEGMVTVHFANGLTETITYHPFSLEDEFNTYTRHAIPLRLCWAYSIHKSQGSTLDSIYIDIGQNIFCPGQAYVALSRCRNINSLYIKSFMASKVYANKKALEFEKTLH